VECLISFVAIVVIITVVVGYGALAQTRADRENGVYRSLAGRFRGHHTPSGWFSRPNIRFRYGATHVLVYVVAPHGKRGPLYTQAMISWPDHSVDAEIFPSRMSPFTSSHVPNEYRLGSEEFAKQFIVRTNDPVAMHVFLSEGVQWQINKLRRILNADEVSIQLTRGRLVVRKEAHIKLFNQLEDFISASLELYDQAMLTRSVGISFVEGEQSSPVEAECQVCGDSITTDMVFCRRCKTPHHLDCWQYYGECSVYGCGEKRCVSPKVAGPG